MHAAERAGGPPRAPSVLSDPRHCFGVGFFFFFSPSKKGGENKIKMIHHSAGKGKREKKKRLNTVAISCFHLANFIPGFYVR